MINLSAKRKYQKEKHIFVTAGKVKKSLFVMNHTLNVLME